jgi:hypothetical protein
MSALSSPPRPSSPALRPEYLLEEELATVCDFGDELYHSAHWNSLFPHFVFHRLVAETDNSLVWTGKYKNTSQIVALKITEIFET